MAHFGDSLVNTDVTGVSNVGETVGIPSRGGELVRCPSLMSSLTAASRQGSGVLGLLTR